MQIRVSEVDYSKAWCRDTKGQDQSSRTITALQDNIPGAALGKCLALGCHGDDHISRYYFSVLMCFYSRRC